MKKYKTIDATAIGSQTCVGGLIGAPYPRKGGNCFDVETASGSYRVLNFRAENLEELLNRGTITWPVKIHVVDKSRCMIHDTRIPHDWYCENLCSICTPFAMMPLTYQMQYARKIATGEIKLSKVIRSGPLKGYQLESQEIKATVKKLKMNWSSETLTDLGTANIDLFISPKDIE
jgi:hypothetical protein